MKKTRIMILLALALALMTAGAAQAAQPYIDDYTGYDNLIGAMEIVNCASWASLRSYPDSTGTRPAKVPWRNRDQRILPQRQILLLCLQRLGGVYSGGQSGVAELQTGKLFIA